MNALLKTRIGSSIYRRPDQFTDWKSQQFDSISQAKDANGLDSRAFLKTAELPPNLNKRNGERRLVAQFPADDRRKTPRRE